MDFQKHLFLFTRNQKSPSFDFIPYKYGCYSFVAERDRQVLIKAGHLANSDHWEICDQGGHASELRGADRIELEAHAQNFNNLLGQELIRYVYKEHPYYATRSKILHDVLSGNDLASVEAARPEPKEKALLTIGYEGKSIEEYLNQLICQDVDILCDVRRNPLSRKFGFSKRSLMRFVQRIGVEYQHYPNLGIPSAKRQSLRTQEDYDTLFDNYESEILPGASSDIDQIVALLNRGKRVALTCFELYPYQCHRSRVAKAIIAKIQWQKNPLNI